MKEELSEKEKLAIQLNEIELQEDKLFKEEYEELVKKRGRQIVAFPTLIPDASGRFSVGVEYRVVKYNREIGG